MSSVKLSQLQTQATKLGASLALVTSRYTNTIQGATPLTIPTTSTTNTSGTARVTGAGGTATVTGSGTSTTTSSRTMMLPYTINRGDFTALYFVKVRARVGLFVLALDDLTRRQLETNAGVRVDIVVEGTPAFDSDILPDDIILAMNSTRIRSPEHFVEVARQMPAGVVEVHLMRGGRPLTKRLTIS
ncbi:MAG: PDZ domain-containing protein [Gemmatimonadaceae bacterium]|nr:PDZ domain-containing protein [Gemmatimonadaceae bacterium]